MWVVFLVFEIGVFLTNNGCFRFLGGCVGFWGVEWLKQMLSNS